MRWDISTWLCPIRRLFDIGDIFMLVVRIILGMKLVGGGYRCGGQGRISIDRRYSVF